MNISVFPNQAKDIGFVHTNALLSFLESRDCTVFVDSSLKGQLEAKKNLLFVDENSLYEEKDVLIVLGGDGSIMRTARRAALQKLPILGINLGRLGYLAEVETNEIEMIDNLFEGNFTVEKRMMLSVELTNADGKREKLPPACNDAVVSVGFLPRILEISLSCGRIPMKQYHADGIIVSTPTGSTAYSLAAGGPLIDPRMNCICVTPICPQSLYDKPMIFSDDSLLEFKINRGPNAEEKVYITIDGSEHREISDNDVISIRRSQYYTRMIKIKNNNFFNVLHNKMSEL